MQHDAPRGAVSWRSGISEARNESTKKWYDLKDSAIKLLLASKNLTAIKADVPTGDSCRMVISTCNLPGALGTCEGTARARPSEVYVRELLPEEQQVLQELYHRTPDATIKTRCQIILLSAKPMSVPQIAQVTFSSEDTVARCIHEFNQSRLESLLPSPKGGRPPKIKPDYLKRLLSIIKQDPRTLGCAFSNWTAPLLAEYLAQETGIGLDESRIRHSLHARGYALLRPVLTVTSPDPEYDNKRVRIEELQRRAEAGEIDLSYEDEIDLALLPTITRCWCKRGHQRKIETPRKNQKRYGAGLIHWVSGKLYWATSDHKDNALFRSVLSQVLEPFGGVPKRKISVVVDIYRIHSCGKPGPSLARGIFPPCLVAPTS